MDDLLGGFSSEPTVQGQQSSQDNSMAQQETLGLSMSIAGNTQENIPESHQNLTNEPSVPFSFPQQISKHVSFSETPQITTIPAQTGKQFIHSTLSQLYMHETKIYLTMV